MNPSARMSVPYPLQQTPATSSIPPAMTEAPLPPNYTPPPYLQADYQHRRLPQPIQLPPLAIPLGSPQSDHHAERSHYPLPSVQSTPTSIATPVRAQYRTYSGPAAPLDKLLSPHPFTPPRSAIAYSPQRSPPRSAVELHLPPRHVNDPHATEYGPRSARLDTAYASPAETQRHAFSTWPSPTAPHVSHHHSSYSTYRPSLHGPPPPPPNLGPPPPQYPHVQHQPQHQQHQPPPPPPPPPSMAPQPKPSHHEVTPSQSSRTDSPATSRGRQPEKTRLNHILRVRQQPIAARACGFGERDRRVIDPPPIIQLEVRDQNNETVDLDELRYSLNVVHCTLWNAEGTHEETALIQQDRRTTRRLMGQLVASPSVAKDEHDVEGCFFCFPDLSCRTHGKYRLRFLLMQIDPMNMHVGGFSPVLTEVLSDVFTVYTAKDFPGMRPSSALTRALKLQGCNIQVKKGNERALARKRQSISSDDGHDDKDGKNKRRRQV